MQSLQMIKTNQLTPDELKKIKQLEQASDAVGGPFSRLYWEAMVQKRPIPGNILCYRQEKLLGYFGLFLFDEQRLHLSAVVDPSEAIQEIFAQLYQSARVEALKLNIHQLIFSFKKENQIVKKYLEKDASTFLQFEYQMERSSKNLEETRPQDLCIKKAVPEDVAQIAAIDAACFMSDYTVMLERFKSIIHDPHRIIWIASFKEEGIGKAHVRFSKQEAMIQDLGIIPRAQKKGYGTQLLKFIVNDLLTHHPSTAITLEVLANNESAIQLYKTCHFEIKETYEEWLIKI